MALKNSSENPVSKNSSLYKCILYYWRIPPDV